MEIDQAQVHASAATYLLEHHLTEAASILIGSSLELEVCDVVDAIDRRTGAEMRIYLLRAEFGCTGEVAEILNDQNHKFTASIKEALNAALPAAYAVDSTYARYEVGPLDPDWRSTLASIALGQVTNNQGVAHGTVPSAGLTWRGLAFRSHSEIKVAEQLEIAAVLFFPNCLVRLNVDGRREVREVDFLICKNGKWGILEVDGPHHGGRAADDHDRDRSFRDNGIRVVERYPANRCFNNPMDVVSSFLHLLEKNG